MLDQIKQAAAASGFTFRMTCSFGSPSANCTNEAVGDMAVRYEDDNIVMLPICDKHLSALDTQVPDGV